MGVVQLGVLQMGVDQGRAKKEFTLFLNKTNKNWPVKNLEVTFINLTIGGMEIVSPNGGSPIRGSPNGGRPGKG